MADQTKPASTFVAARTAIVDENRMATWSFMQILLNWDTKLRNGLNSTGQLIGNIDPATRVLPRVEGLGQTLQNINSSGVMEPAGLFPASTLVQGAVIMPVGATNNRLGTAAIQPATAFDASGSAAGAQTAAQTYAAAQASAAQTNAENYTNSFASNAANLTTGTLPVARLSGLSVTITTAALTTGGTQGSMTFTHGLLTAQVQAT